MRLSRRMLAGMMTFLLAGSAGLILSEHHPEMDALQLAIVTATPLPPVTPTLIATTPPSPTPVPRIMTTPIVRQPAQVNGIPLEQIAVLPPGTRRRVKMIYDLGQILGRNAQAFSRLGDSVIENPHFLARFDGGEYNLGQYAYLQGVLDYYAGSYGRQGVAVRRGLHSWSVFDPLWAPEPDCWPEETLIACEFRLNNPAILFIRLGSNDFGVPESFEKALRQIIEYCMNHGVIPILSTKADRYKDPADVNNTIIRKLAGEYRIPLWDFDVVAGTIPGKGIGADGVHLTTFFAHDYRQPHAFQTGYGLQNLTALMVLDAVWQITQNGNASE